MAFDLQAARLNAGLSIRALARETDVPEQSIRRFEAGDGGLHPSNAKKIADRFAVQVTDLMPLVRAA